MLRVRSGNEVEVPGSTSVWTVALVVKFWADRVPVTLAVLLMVVPAGAVTTPRTVTVNEPPPLTVPRLQLTSCPLCVHVPLLDVMTYCGVAGGAWIVPIPFSWSLSTTLLSFAPPVFVPVMV